MLSFIKSPTLNIGDPFEEGKHVTGFREGRDNGDVGVTAVRWPGEKALEVAPHMESFWARRTEARVISLEQSTLGEGCVTRRASLTRRTQKGLVFKQSTPVVIGGFSLTLRVPQ